HLELSADGPVVTPYHVQAAIASIHARATGPSGTAWREILAHYDELLDIHPSPVVALNRIVALAMVDGPRAALDALKPLENEPALDGYYLMPSVKGRLLAETGDLEGAAACYRAALECECTAPERRLLERRLRALDRSPA